MKSKFEIVAAKVLGAVWFVIFCIATATTFIGITKLLLGQLGVM